MAKFNKNPERYDPYKNFKFLMYFGNGTDPVAGVSKVGALSRSTEVIEHREGGDPSTVHKAPGQVSYESIELERGLTHDKAFEQWANKVWYVEGAAGKEVSLKDFRKDIRLVLQNEAGQPVKAFNIFNCWVSEFQALPELDASGNAVAIENITLENEGWIRDTDVKEPAQQSFTKPGD